MLSATEIRTGNIIRLDGKICRVLSQDIKGHGKVGKTVHVKARSLEDGNVMEKNLRSDDKVEDLEFHRVKMQYLYRDGNNLIFMNSENYEQFPVAAASIGNQALFLKENSEIEVDFVEEKPVAVNLPQTVEVRVLTAPPPLKGGSDSTYKEAVTEHDLKVPVPQFIKEGESIIIRTDDFSYVDRVTRKSL